MIYEIFIIKNGGQCLLRKSVSDSKKIRIDDDLFSSFTSAISSFASELKETVQSIELMHCKLVFFSFKKLLLIAVSEKFDDNLDVQRKLALLANDFSRKFNQCITTWSGNLTDFNGFDEKIACILLNSRNDSHFSWTGIRLEKEEDLLYLWFYCDKINKAKEALHKVIKEL